VCVNRYLGWYTQVGQIAAGCRQLAQDLDAIATRFEKPILLTEFGAEALAGNHAYPAEMFSEEYQADLLMDYLDVLEQHPAVSGYYIWNLCDFKTVQSSHRVGGINMKGIFTRDRRPKLAAHRLHARWRTATASGPA
jgi:beta-glucuronidase